MKDNDNQKDDYFSIWRYLERKTDKTQKASFFMLTSIEDVLGKKKKKKSRYHFYKKNRSDKVWWSVKPNADGVVSPGPLLISFDKKRVYSLFSDYPHNFTDEQKEIFDKQEPFWADFFKNRPRHRIKIRCIVDNIPDLTKGKVYEILEEDDEGLWNVANDKDEYYHFYAPSFFEVVETYNETYAKKAINKQ